MSRIIYKIRDKKRINKCGKHLYGWKNSIPLGFLYSKITVEDRFLHKFIFCVPSFGAFRYKLSIKFYHKEDSFNEDKESTNTGSYEKVRQNGCKKEYGKEGCHTDQQY